MLTLPLALTLALTLTLTLALTLALAPTLALTLALTLSLGGASVAPPSRAGLEQGAADAARRISGDAGLDAAPLGRRVRRDEDEARAG